MSRRRAKAAAEETGETAAAEVERSSRNEEDVSEGGSTDSSSDADTLVGTTRTVLPSPHKVKLEQRRSVRTVRLKDIIRPLGKTRENDQEKVAWLMESIQEIGLQV